LAKNLLLIPFGTLKPNSGFSGVACFRTGGRRFVVRLGVPFGRGTTRFRGYGAIALDLPADWFWPGCGAEKACFQRMNDNDD
jgi:hypothetical protein